MDELRTYTISGSADITMHLLREFEGGNPNAVKVVENDRDAGSVVVECYNRWDKPFFVEISPSGVPREVER